MDLTEKIAHKLAPTAHLFQKVFQKYAEDPLNISDPSRNPDVVAEESSPEESVDEIKQTITVDPLKPAYYSKYFPDPYDRFPVDPWDEFDRMTKEDSRAGTNIKKRIQLLLSNGINVRENENNPQGQTHAEFIEEVFEKTPIKKNVAKILTSIGYGFQVVQTLWKEPEPGVFIPYDFRSLQHKDFKPKVDGQIEYCGTLYRNIDTLMADLFAKYPYKFIWHTHESSPNNDPRGIGVYARAYWYWKFKNQDLVSWVKLIERYGIPSMLAIFSQLGANLTVQETAEYLAGELKKLQYDSAAAMSGIDELKILETNSEGDVFDKLAALCNDEIDMATLGTTMLSAPKGGSYALANVHGEVLKLQTQADGEALAETLNNTLIKWIIDLNFGEQEQGYPIFEFNFREFADIADLWNAVDRKVPVSLDAMYDQYNLPRPVDEADTFVMADTPAVQTELADLQKKKRFSLLTNRRS